MPEAKAGRMRPLQEAVDEVEREFNVRVRCFPGWVQSGKVSATDAHDRQERLWTALVHLKKLLDLQGAANDIPKPGTEVEA